MSSSHDWKAVFLSRYTGSFGPSDAAGAISQADELVSGVLGDACRASAGPHRSDIGRGVARHDVSWGRRLVEAAEDVADARDVDEIKRASRLAEELIRAEVVCRIIGGVKSFASGASA
jgi:hypothetical protein